MTSTDFSYFKTKPGILRLAHVGTCLLAIVFSSVAVHNSDWIQSRLVCSVWNCAHPWLAQVGISLVVPAGLFSLVMLIVLLVLKMEPNRRFTNLDFKGHLVSGFGLITAFVFFTTFVVLDLCFYPCEDDASDPEQSVSVLDCIVIQIHREDYLQLSLFLIAVVLALSAGILAIFVAKAAKQLAQVPLLGLKMSNQNQSK